MKKTLFSLMAAAAALLVSSCAKEVQPSVAEGDEVAVELNLALENGAQTRAAVGDGTTVNQLTYSLFRVVGPDLVLVETFGQGGQVRKGFNYPDYETINLAKGQTYRLAFWADVVGNTHYTLDKSMNVTVNYDGINNDETRDAFHQYIDIKVTESTKIDVELVRPFAQLNVGATVADWTNAVTAGIDVKQSTVTLKGVANTIDVARNKVGGNVDLTYDLEAIPANKFNEDLTLDLDGNGEKEAYKWLSMSYILPTDVKNSTLLESLEFQFKPAVGETIVINQGLNNVPVQRNWRTNIVGQLLTGTIDLYIHIDPVFENDHNINIPTQPVEPDEEGVYEVTNENELLLLAQQINGGDKLAGKSIKLMNDINMAGVEWTPLNLWGPDTKTLAEIDGNGFAIKNLEVKGAGSLGFIGSYASSSVLTVKNLTFENPTVESTANFVGTVVGYTYGNITLDNVKVTGANISTTANMGIRLGGLVGLYPADAVQPLVLNKCVTENSTITGYHNLAGLIGSTMGSKATMTNCQSNNNTFYHRAENPASWQNYDANGYGEGKSVKTGCTTTGNKGLKPVADGVALNAAGEYEISNAAGMVWFADQVNVAGENFAGKTVKLVKEVDLKNEPWTPIGQTGATEFKGVFDGQGNDIRNLYIKNTDESANCATGLFGWVESHGDENVTIKNVTVIGAKVYGHHYVAVIAGYLYGKVIGCTVYDAEITCEAVNEGANGDKCGAIVGYLGEDALIQTTVVSNVKIKAGRDAGLVVGAAKPACVKVSSGSQNGTVEYYDPQGLSSGENLRQMPIGREL